MLSKIYIVFFIVLVILSFRYINKQDAQAMQHCQIKHSFGTCHKLIYN